MSDGETQPDPDRIRRDPERLNEVRATHLLDTPAEEVFDRITRLASRILKVPVSFISIVDADRDFYKSSIGFPDTLARERELDGRTFCHYALLSEEPLVLPDTISRAPFRDVHLSSDGASALVRIRDSGRGIAHDALPHVFDLFMQAGESQAGSLGIGLKVVQSVVHLHGGTVTAASDGPGLGSEFVVTLPLSSSAD